MVPVRCLQQAPRSSTTALRVALVMPTNNKGAFLPPTLPTLPAHPLSSQAREAYERACKLEPSDSQLQVALQKATAREAKQVGGRALSAGCSHSYCWNRRAGAVPWSRLHSAGA